MTALREDLDLDHALEAVDQAGAAYLHDAIDNGFLHQLRNEVARLPFEPMAAEEGRARQGGEVHPLHDLASTATVHQLGDELADSIHTRGAAIPGCPEWQPNEVFIQRYQAGDLGITPHLDLKRYRYLVAIVTAEGAAPFTLCKDRSGAALTTWPADAGSLILLRGPGLGHVERARPLHAVSGPSAGQRISISYRMDTSTP